MVWWVGGVGGVGLVCSGYLLPFVFVLDSGFLTTLSIYLWLIRS